jgi:putative transposase
VGRLRKAGRLGEDGLFKQLKKALLERALGAELTHHLGYEKGDPVGRGTGNNRNGSYAKTVLTEDGSVEIDVPRDRNGSFEPQIVAKGETAWTASTTRSSRCTPGA